MAVSGTSSFVAIVSNERDVVAFEEASIQMMPRYAARDLLQNSSAICVF